VLLTLTLIDGLRPVAESLSTGAAMRFDHESLFATRSPGARVRPVLLAGRWLYGWRGPDGVALDARGLPDGACWPYVGSRFVLEVVLHG
jgi:ABC-type uncharacterized transport system permease subunit